MLVSVIVPVYKVEQYLSNCIESILQQSFEDYELILVDDGSPDNCGKICDDFAQKDSRIIVIHQENKGLSAARNKAIEYARGEYLTFVDSDDFIFPHYLEILVNLCLKNDADMAVCGMIRCSVNDSLRNLAEDISKMNVEIFIDNKMEVFFTTKKINTTAWGKLYRRFIFDSIRYPIGKYHEDIFVTYKTIHLSNKIVSCDYQGYIYRINEMSIVNEPFSMKKLHPIEACVERALFIEQNYPKQKKHALCEIVYYCNQIVLSMAKTGVFNKDILKKLQHLYRKYLWYYISDKTDLMGKFFAMISFVDVRIAYGIIKLLKK